MTRQFSNGLVVDCVPKSLGDVFASVQVTAQQAAADLKTVTVGKAGPAPPCEAAAIIDPGVHDCGKGLTILAVLSREVPWSLGNQAE
jgi:hypothetical protein